jgi:hypothetical protein
MTLEQMSRRRKMVGRLGTALCLVIAFGVLDALIAHIRTSPYSIDAVPGQSVNINGPMPERIKSREELTYQSSSEDLSVEIVRIQTGYWLGGNIWTGVVHLGQDISPQTHQFMVRPHEVKEGETFPLFELTVHEDQASLRSSAKSFIRRFTGLQPWLFSLLTLPLAVLAFYGVYRLSMQRSALLLAQGKGEVLRVKKIDNQLEIALSMGERHGVGKGTRIVLYDRQGQPLASVEVVKSFPAVSIALAPLECPAWPGQLISKM